MPVTYIPSTDGDFSTWSNNFSALITAAPTSYGLTASDGSALAALVTTWNAAYAAALSGATRGPFSVNVKDTARANLTARARQLQAIIQANPGVTDSQKTALGLTVRKTLPTPIPAPTTSPLLQFIAATPLQHTLRFSDQATPALRAKPFGVLSLQLYVSVPGGLPPTGPGPNSLVYTKNPIAVNFADANVGQVATYAAAWITRTGLLGPISTQIQAVVVGSAAPPETESARQAARAAIGARTSA